MFSVAHVAWAVVAIACAVFAAPASRNNETCTAIHPVTGEVIDLNVLAGAGGAELHDYIVVSEKFPKYEYAFNVCRKLAYADDVCVEGSTVCDRSSSKLTTVTVYGEASSQSLTYGPYNGNETAKVLTLAYTAGECMYRPNKPTSAKFFFICDRDAFVPQISLNFEDYLECEVEVNFVTVAACGTKDLKFACSETGSCQPALDGKLAHTECESSCNAPVPPPSPEPTPAPSPAPPAIRYGCNTGVAPGLCYEATGGEYDDKETCDSECHFIPHMYACDGDKGCLVSESGKFRSEAECLVSCNTPPSPPSPPSPPEKKYACSADFKCEENAGGKFNSEGDCEADCKAPAPPPPPEKTYTCSASFKCEEKVGGKYNSQGDCELDCKDKEDSYKCVENKCVEEPGGVKKEVCAQLCNVADVFAAMAAKAKRNATRTQPYAFPGYACINGRVTPSLHGLSRAAAHAACGDIDAAEL